MRIGLDEAVALNRRDEIPQKRKIALLFTVFIACFLIFLVWRNGSLPDYPLLLQLEGLGVTAACGMLLALGGSIFQSVFRNPMAAPTMLGVSSGVQVAVIWLIIVYGGAIVNFPLERYKYSYLGAGIMLGLIMLLGKLASGPGKFQIADLLLIGICISSIIGTVVTAYVMATDDTILYVYMDIMSKPSVDVDRLSIISLMIIAVFIIIFFWLMRFSMNTLSLNSDEAKGLGVHPFRLRVVSLVFGTIMVATVIIHCGMVATLALVVPYLSRFVFGPDYRRQFWGNALIGAIILMVCFRIAELLPMIYDQPFPMMFVINIFIMPLFAFVMGMSRKGWDR